jgi:hypothetical protein
MQVRLGFAVATGLSQPDVLILDEVLAVGDAAFRAKCLIKVSGLIESAAVIFVSHQDSQVARLCNLGLLLHNGNPLAFGPASDILKQYLLLRQSAQPVPQQLRVVNKDAGVDIVELQHNPCVTRGEPIMIACRVLNFGALTEPVLFLGVSDHAGVLVGQSRFELGSSYTGRGDAFIKLLLPQLDLNPGLYHLNLRIAEHAGKLIVARLENACSVQVVGCSQTDLAYSPTGQVTVEMSKS